MKDFDMKVTGQRILELRQDKKLSQAKLAELIGAAQNTIAQYENGTAKTSIEIICTATRGSA